MNGYMGKILRVDLTTGNISTIDTGDYEAWGGGHGIGSAIFYDIVVREKKIDLSSIDGFDPANVITIITSPLGGTLVPAASARVEVQGIGVQSSPIGWFTRSNFGGRFAGMLKYAGWDGIVVEGKADRPVWIDIRNGSVRISSAEELWGLDTRETQEAIWAAVMGGEDFGDWLRFSQDAPALQTTQRPAVLTIGPAGENLSRMGSLIHDAGNASGQGGFGGVWGSKNLKAISIIGTGSVGVADPNALIEAWSWAVETYGHDLEGGGGPTSWFGRTGTNLVEWKRPERARLHACLGCHRGCHERSDTGVGNDSTCQETSAYRMADINRHGQQTDVTYQATDLLQKQGINSYEAMRGVYYLRDLNAMGVLGPGMEIDCNLPFDRFGELDFYEQFVSMIVNREGAGDDMAEGFYRAAQRWGRLEEDLATGVLEYSYWGLPEHGYDPRAQVEWGYGSILGDRDVNEHDFNYLFWMATNASYIGINLDPITKLMVDTIAEKLRPYYGPENQPDPLMLDYSTANIYSDHMARLVAWHRHYNRFWKQSALYCEQRWADFFNFRTPGFKGLTGEGEPRFFNAVTGKNLTFEDGMEIGRRIWNLDHAIWTLQGRHRDMVHFSKYLYELPYEVPDYRMPGRENGEWKFIQLAGRILDRGKFEEFKTRFYNLEGWDPASGYPNRDTLESLELEEVADELESRGRLGNG